MIRTIIIDDEPLALQLLGDYINKTDGIHLAGAFTNPIEGLQFLDSAQIDLIFLDVQMPELTGIQFMKIIKGKFPVILTTAYDEYAMQGYDFDIIDYLLKPITLDRFLIGLQKATKRLTETVTPVKVKEATPYIFVKTSYKTQKVNLADILYLEGLGDYVAIHTSTGKILTLEKMKNFSSILNADEFIRVHKSFIIPIQKIEYIEKNRIKIQEKLIPIGATYQEAFWKKINS